jgi:2-hydroxymuconate-semialdehyde hydrolase
MTRATAPLTHAAARRRLLAGLPVTERRVRVAGVDTLILEGGEGPPLILLHGGVESGGAYWTPVIERLAANHRLLVPDVPGFGESDPFERFTAEAFSHWFAALVRERVDSRPAVVVHSLFGGLAAGFAARHDVLRRLVIYGAPGVGPYRMPLGLQVIAIRSDLRPTQRNLKRFLRWPFLDPEGTRRRDPEWFEAFLSHLLHCSRVKHTKRAMRRLVGVGTKQTPDVELRAIAIPTALIWGREDRMIALRYGEAASARLGWPLHVIDAAGHLPHLEQPEPFLRALGEALGESHAAREEPEPVAEGPPPARSLDGG